MEEEGLLSSFVLRVPGEHRMPQPENCLLQRPTCLGRSSSISSCASLSILRYRGRFLAFSSTVRTSGEGCAFTSHQLVPRKGLCTGQMGARPRGDPDLGGGRQKVWVATKRPTKKSVPDAVSRFSQTSRYCGVQESLEIEALGKGL